jgi:hypothetical protein
MEPSTFKKRKKKEETSLPTVLSKDVQDLRDSDPRPQLYTKLSSKIQQHEKHGEHKSSKISPSKTSSSSSIQPPKQVTQESQLKTSFASGHDENITAISSQSELTRADPNYVQKLFSDLSKKITARSEKVH